MRWGKWREQEPRETCTDLLAALNNSFFCFCDVSNLKALQENKGG